MAGNQAKEKERLKTLLKDTVTLLCRNSLVYRDDLKIEGVIGITVDEKDVLLVHINDAFPTQKVMQPNISSTSGYSRSNTPVHNDVPVWNDVPGQLKSNEHITTYSSVRSLPISRHRNLKRRHFEPRTNNYDIGLKSGSESKIMKTRPQVSAFCHTQKLDIGFASISSTPEYTFVPIANGKNVKEERPSESDSEALHLKKEKSEDNQETPTVEVADLKLVAPSVPVTAEIDQEDYLRKSFVYGAEQKSLYHQPKNNDTIGELTLDARNLLSTNTQSPFTKGIIGNVSTANNVSQSDDSEDEINSVQIGSFAASVQSLASMFESNNHKKEDVVRRYPSCTLSSKSIKHCLQTKLIVPLVENNHWALAVRVSWRNNPDQAWNQILRARQECDMTIGALDGVSFFLSAITGLFSHASARGETSEKTVYPAISYWVGYGGTHATLNYENLLSSLNELDLGCEVKRLITHGREPILTDISNALFITVKDHNNTCVRHKLDHSTKLCFGTAAKKIPCVKFIVNNLNVKALIKQAHRELLRVNLESTLESWV